MWPAVLLLALALATCTSSAPLPPTRSPQRRSASPHAAGGTPRKTRFGSMPSASPSTAPTPSPPRSASPSPSAAPSDDGGSSDAEEVCAFSAETRAAIAELFCGGGGGGGGGGGDDARTRASRIVLTCVQDTLQAAGAALGAAVTELGVDGATAAGGVAGAVGGAAAGAALGEALAQRLFGDDFKAAGQWLGAGVGALTGGVFGGVAGRELALAFTAGDFMADGGPAATLAACRAELGLPPRGTVAPDALKRAYKERARKAHPDRGGSQEAFVRLSFCREALAAAAAA
jgi:hypothetical protein